MVGVSNPLMRARRNLGARFVGGLAVGLLGSSVLVTLGVVTLFAPLESSVAPSLRTAVAAGGIALLGVLDMANRTPQAVRQTPQRLAATLSPGWLGLAYGFDIGLLVTTQKTTSLIWAGSVGVAALAATGAPAYFLLVAVVTATAIALQSLFGRPLGWQGLGGVKTSTWVRGLRGVSGLVLLSTAVATYATYR